MSSLGPESRALLDEGREALRPTTADRERILGALNAQVGAGSLDPIGDLASPAAASGIGWPVVSTVVVGLAFGGGLLLHQASSGTDSVPPPSASVTPRATASSSASSVPERLADEPAALAARPSTESRSPASGRAPDRLAAEVALLARAQTELHAGRFTSALALLGEHQRKFPRGALTQERVAARIQALCGLGRIKEADTELARVSPDSLHGGRTREACASSKSR